MRDSYVTCMRFCDLYAIRMRCEPSRDAAPGPCRDRRSGESRHPAHGSPDGEPAESRDLQAGTPRAAVPVPLGRAAAGGQAKVSTGSPSTSARGATPRPGAAGAAMRPRTRCGAPSAMPTVT